MKALWTLYKRAYQKKYLKFAILAIVFMIIDVMITLAIPALTYNIVNEGLNKGDLSYVVRVGIFVVGIALFAVIFTVINNIAAQYLSQSITTDIRDDLFRKVQNLSFSNIDQITTGKLITIITNDTLQIQQLLVMSFRIILRAPLMLIGAIVMSYITNPDLFIIILIAVPILILGFLLIMKTASPYFLQLQQRVDNLNSKLLESISGAREIKTFVTGQHDQDEFNRVNNEYHRTIVKANKIVSFFNPFTTLVTNIAFGAVLYVGAYYSSIYVGVEASNMIGAIMTYIAYIMNIVFALSMLSMITIFITRANISAQRIDMVFQTDIDIINKADAISNYIIDGDIEFKNVFFRYSGNDDLSSSNTLSNINLKIKKGTTTGVIGSTGSGKTSLVQLIPRLYDVTKGEVLIDGINVKDFDLKLLREQVSFVTQEAIIFEGTIKSNILQGKQEASLEDLQEAAKNAVADEYINRFEKSYETKVTQEGSSLSGGQRQRLSLARAFVRKPKILILDDSTSAVDAKSEALIKENIKMLSKNMTTIIVAQKISSISDCDNIIVLDNKGQVDGFGSHIELLKSSEVYKEIYLSQFGGVLSE